MTVCNHSFNKTSAPKACEWRYRSQIRTKMWHDEGFCWVDGEGDLELLRCVDKRLSGNDDSLSPRTIVGPMCTPGPSLEGQPRVTLHHDQDSWGRLTCEMICAVFRCILREL